MEKRNSLSDTINFQQPVGNELLRLTRHRIASAILDSEIVKTHLDKEDGISRFKKVDALHDLVNEYVDYRLNTDSASLLKAKEAAEYNVQYMKNTFGDFTGLEIAKTLMSAVDAAIDKELGCTIQK